MFKTVNLLFVFFCIFSHFLQAQDLQEPDNFDNIPYTYTSVQIDSMDELLKKDLYDAHYDKVIEKGPNLIQYAQDINYRKGEQSAISLLGNTFIRLDDTKKASHLFNKALAKAKKTKDSFSLGSLYINLGNTYIKKDPKKAILYFEESYRIGTQVKNDRISFIALNNISELYIGIKNATKAQYYVDKALPLVQNSKTIDIDNKVEYIATVYYVQGSIYLLEKKYEQAISYILKSMELGKNEYQEQTLITNYKNLLEAYDKTNQLEKINIIRKQYDSLRDKQYEADKILQQQIARSKFRLDQIEQELKASELEKLLAQQKASKSKLLSTFSLAMGGILLLILALLLYVRRKRFKLLKDLKAKNIQYLEAKEKSEKLTQAKTKLFSTISHELRTPLYGIIGLSSSLLKDPKLKTHIDDLTSLKFSADYLLALVNNVLNLNKLDSQTGHTIQNSNFKLNSLLHNITQSFEFINQQNNNSVYIDIDPTIPKKLHGDQTKVSQILMNLVGNASKFTQDGRIDIFIKKQYIDDKKVSLFFSIMDTGIGIPEEQQDKIFEEFNQGTNHSNYQGSGLGLPIVNRVLKILGSKLMFKSTYGKGSTFSCVLSFSRDIIENEAPIEEVCIQKLQDKKILIVDDNKINQLVTQKVLEQHGMSHGVASNGLDAIEKAKEQSYDAILMDVNMPIMNGLDSSREIRNIGLNVPIIALTAVNSENPEKDFGFYGIDDAIVKPYRIEQLLELLLKYTS